MDLKQQFIDPNAPTFTPYDYQDPFAQYTYMQEASPRLGFASLNLSHDYPSSYPSAPIYPPQRPYTPVDSLSVSPQTILASVSAASASDGDHSSGPKRAHDASSGRSASPPELGPRASQSSLVHRQPLRHSASSSTTTTRASTRERPPKRRASKSDDLSDDDIDEDYAPSATGPAEGYGEHRVVQKRREEIRRQRIESEQRRRDELREGYRKLKDVLPSSNQKSSKVSLLDRATLHIKYLEMTQTQLQNRLQAAEMETQRLRLVNEKLMIGAAEHQQAQAAAAAAVHGSALTAY
jgi:hypothetical protein